MTTWKSPRFSSEREQIGTRHRKSDHSCDIENREEASRGISDIMTVQAERDIPMTGDCPEPHDAMQAHVGEGSGSVEMGLDEKEEHEIGEDIPELMVVNQAEANKITLFWSCLLFWKKKFKFYLRINFKNFTKCSCKNQMLNNERWSLY